MQVTHLAIHRQACMQVITSWTGGHADALRQAKRMTNESFGELLNVAVRTVASWRKNPGIIPTAKIQESLDTALDRASDRAKAQFAMLIGQTEHDKRPDQVES